jgi:VWFA-related protein
MSGIARKFIVFPLLISWLLNISLTGKQQTNQSLPTFRAEARQVIVDVVVTDHGHFVAGLKPADFVVTEDGKPQKIAAFAMHAVPATPPKPAPPIKLPPNQYTNYAIADPERPITIILMDVLNTQVQDQAYTRKQMIEFLKDLPPGQRVALFALGTKLTTIQGFTGDSDTLVAAAKSLLRSSSPLMGSEAQRQNDEITASNLAVNAAPASMGPSGGTSSSTANTSFISAVSGAIQKALAAEQSYQQMQRMEITLAALESLARAVSAYPGRKNLLWLSAEFPVRFGPDFLPVNQATDLSSGGFQANEQARNVRGQGPPVRETAALLTASQIAVYPIDIRGTIVAGTGIDLSAPGISGSMERIGAIRSQASERQTTTEWDSHESMTDIARETGGQAFYGSNDIKAALSKSMDEGENYYTIAYAPQNKKWDGKYRKIEVKCLQGGAKLTFRRGYYAVPDTFQSPNSKAASDEISRLFATAMHPAAPTSTMLLLKVQVLPPDATHKTIRIDYAINAHDVTFTETPEQEKHLLLDVMAVAWDKDNKDAGDASGAIDKSIPLQTYMDIMRSFIPAHQELQLKPGSYTLRVGVVDRNSRKIGTLDIPLTVPELQSSAK